MTVSAHALTAVVERLEALGRVGRGDTGMDRVLFSPAEHAARATLVAWSREAGLDVVQDRVGNLFARRRGRDDGRAALQFGSHLDTVRNGGMYDGAYGVIGGLCALELLAERAIETHHPLELAAWAGEEGSRFPLGCLGSSVYAGLVPYETVLALHDDDGVSFADALGGRSGLVAGIPVRADFPVPAAYLELHIEQGPILEQSGVRLGIVTGIAGQARLHVTVRGTAGHAGTIPMPLRRDAFSAAAEVALAVEAAARSLGDCVATVGWVRVEPNQTNIVPGRVDFRVDTRSVNDASVGDVIAVLERLGADVAARRNVAVEIERLECRPATPLDPRLRDDLATAIASLDTRALDVPSGAGHDAMCIATIAPAAMLFVPSIGGASHVEHERTTPEDLRLGVEALAAAIVAVDRDLAGAAGAS